MTIADVKELWTTLSDMIEGGCPGAEIDAWIYTKSEDSSLTDALGREAASDLLAFDFGRTDAAATLRPRWRALATKKHPQLAICLRARRLAAGLLDGTVDLVDGCQELHELRVLDEQADIVPTSFTGWASEFDDVPGTRSRSEWLSSALVEKLAKVALYKDDVLLGAKTLLDRLEPMIARCLGLP